MRYNLVPLRQRSVPPTEYKSRRVDISELRIGAGAERPVVTVSLDEVVEFVDGADNMVARAWIRPDPDRPGHYNTIAEGYLRRGTERPPTDTFARSERTEEFRMKNPYSEVLHLAGPLSVDLNFGIPVGMAPGPGTLGLPVKYDAYNQLVESQGIEGFLRRFRSGSSGTKTKVRMVSENAVSHFKDSEHSLVYRRYSVFVEQPGKGERLLFSMRVNIGERPGLVEPVWLKEFSGKVAVDDIFVSPEPWATSLLDDLRIPQSSDTPLQDAYARALLEWARRRAGAR